MLHNYVIFAADEEILRPMHVNGKEANNFVMATGIGLLNFIATHLSVKQAL